MLPWSTDLAGRLDEHVIVSGHLRGNPLGDPHERPLWIYVPPGYDSEPGRRYPAVYVIQGYTGHVATWRNRTPFRQPFPELLDQMFAAGEAADDGAPPAIVVYVDAWTALGGSQYLDSPGTGDYHSYLCQDVVSFVDERYRTIADRDHRAITGKSSGGYGAMINAMLRPDVFGAFATHAGDSLFEIVAPPMFAAAARLLRDRYDGSYDKFFADLRSRIFGTRDSDAKLLEVYAYAAAYSAEPDGTVLIPFDETGRIIPEVWQRWLARDPVRMAAEPRYAEALRSMRAIWIDAGNRDDYHLDLGAAAFHQAIRAAGVPGERIHFELFDATHAMIEYRYPLAIAWLLRQDSTI
ncbi:MAG TPA: alpha/beta hydrolase-fold protein [Micromonosporaceae bacterium]|nr:alpha/beta hydrolase-fold protein [Micromonosporaceae bacterium]